MPSLGDRSPRKSPQRRLVDDLLFAFMGPLVAFVVTTLRRDGSYGNALTFGLTWLVLGLLTATGRYLLARRRAAQVR